MNYALKIGGSVITDKSKPYTARREVISRISREVKGALSDSGDKTRLLIGNGGGSFPHTPAKKGDIINGIKEPWQLEYFALTQKAASSLNRILVDELLKSGVSAFSIQPSAAGIAENGEIKSMESGPIKKLMELGMVPVVYGDAFADTKRGSTIISTEQIIRHLSDKIRFDRILIATNTDGVLDNGGRAISEITTKNFDSIKKYLGGAEATDVTGGMKHKVEMMLELAKKGTDVYIFNALKSGNVKKALTGAELGTKLTR